jgi:drug/metabolite transporter (DMT)-like permease
MSAGTKYQL